jgi:hypothetical protein
VARQLSNGVLIRASFRILDQERWHWNRARLGWRSVYSLFAIELPLKLIYHSNTIPGRKENGTSILRYSLSQVMNVRQETQFMAGAKLNPPSVVPCFPDSPVASLKAATGRTRTGVWLWRALLRPTGCLYDFMEVMSS